MNKGRQYWSFDSTQAIKPAAILVALDSLAKRIAEIVDNQSRAPLEAAVEVAKQTVYLEYLILNSSRNEQGTAEQCYGNIENVLNQLFRFCDKPLIEHFFDQYGKEQRVDSQTQNQISGANFFPPRRAVNDHESAEKDIDVDGQSPSPMS